MTRSEIESLMQLLRDLPRTSPNRGAIHRIIRNNKTAELREAVFWAGWAQRLSKEVQELGGHH